MSLTMSTTRPTITTPVQARRTDRGFSYELPPRNLGKARWGGLLFVLFGVFSGGFAYVWLKGTLDFGSGDDLAFNIVGIVFALAALPVIGVTLFMLLLGFGVLLNALRSEVLVTPTHLYAIERFGLFRWKRKRKIEGIDRLALGNAISSADLEDSDVFEGREHLPEALSQLSGIRALGQTIKPLVIAAGYPRHLLEPLATQLAQQVNAQLPMLRRDGIRAAETHAAVEVVDDEVARDEREAQEDDPDALIQPPDSDVVFRDHADSLSFLVPPAGIWKGSHGLFLIGLVWNVFVGVFVSAMIFSDDSDAGLMPFALLGLFLLVGFAIMLSGYNIGKRQAAIAVQGDQVSIKRISPFRTRDWNVSTNEIKAIRKGPSGMEVNDRPVMELQVHLAEGEKIGILSQRDDEEIDWIAAVLRHKLGVGRR